ncbi:MAG TPA: putative HNHc nuclease, partial [Candidatus Nitrosocosmicus sp.]|nr:putative HNHc nuclease [Candidatus Nitrosocosmicus sp.]
MIHTMKVLGIKSDDEYTYLQVRTGPEIINEINRVNTGAGVFGQIIIDDSRRISAIQRKKIYATVRDIADYIGDIPELVKEFLKYEFCIEQSIEHFSLSDCSITVAREFISFILDFVIKHGIPLSELGIDRTDDIDKYLYSCLKFRRCCICGKDGEIHHEDTIGMGNDRTDYDDSLHKKISLCRVHHTEAHTIGVSEFRKKYKVYG